MWRAVICGHLGLVKLVQYGKQPWFIWSLVWHLEQANEAHRRILDEMRPLISPIGRYCGALRSLRSRSLEGETQRKGRRLLPCKHRSSIAGFPPKREAGPGRKPPEQASTNQPNAKTGLTGCRAWQELRQGNEIDIGPLGQPPPPLLSAGQGQTDASQRREKNDE